MKAMVAEVWRNAYVRSRVAQDALHHLVKGSHWRHFLWANLFAGLSGFAAGALWPGEDHGLYPLAFERAAAGSDIMPTLGWAIAVLLVRVNISRMDVPTQQSYTVAVVSFEERSAAAAITGVARTTGAAL